MSSTAQAVTAFKPGMAARQVVVMGVSGCGKTTVGQVLATALGAHFVEGDALHPPANVARMAAGIALTDADRQDWLQAVALALADADRQGATAQGVVVSCSALKRSYRDLLRHHAPGLRLVYLCGAQPLIAQRLAARQGHFMPPGLLQSQFDALEPPGADECPVVLDIHQNPEALAAEAARRLQTCTV